MSEDGEMWSKIHEEQAEKKRSNEVSSIAILRDKGIGFIAHPGAAHYQVGDFHFWPTTGKFYNPKTGKKGRGVFNLLKLIK